MNSFKKFEFDNFILDEDEAEIPSQPVIHEVEAVEAVPTAQPVSPVVEPEPEIITYTQEEYDKAMLIAEQQGYEKGYKAKDCEIEKQAAQILDQINSKLLDLISSRESRQQELMEDFMRLNREVIRKLIPVLNQEQAVEILNRFLAENFPSFGSEAKLSFYLHPDVISLVSEQIAKLAHSHDFEGKISLHKDASLGAADCRIEWENGGVERSSDKILEKIDNLLEDNSAKN